jgi:drug/metabolite transporter (DMT)-like permease
VCYALYTISTRALARTDSNETTLFYSNLVGAVAMMPALPFIWRAPDGLLAWTLLLMTGVFGSLGHYLLIAAHRLASPSVLAPFIYVQLIWATMWGYLLFRDVPDRFTRRRRNRDRFRPLHSLSCAQAKGLSGRAARARAGVPTMAPNP